MQWFVFAFASAFFVAVATLLEKRGLKHEHSMEFSMMFAILSAAMGLPLIFLAEDLMRVSPEMWLLIALTSFLSAIAFYMIIEALRHMDVSFVSPLSNINSIFVAIIAFIALGESITAQNALGIILIVAGAYSLEAREITHHHFRKLLSHKYLILVLASAAIYAVSSIVTKVILDEGVLPVTLVLTAQVSIALFMLSFFLLMHKDEISNVPKHFRRHGIWVIGAAAFAVLHRLLQAQAISMAYVSLVIPIRRLSSLFSTLIGGELFHEKNLLQKGIACIVMIAGSVLVIL
jgi:drug/metabolite transporter (DMT)-like permease